MRSPFLSYARHSFDESEVASVAELMRNEWIARGPRIRKFEELICEQLSYEHCVSCSNGSVAIEIVLRALGLGPGDQVIVPTLSWASTATSVSMVGATPVFADIDPATYCISASSIRSLITPETRAVIPVHFAGIACDMEAIWNIAEEHGLYVLEDCAHALGGSYSDGNPVGSSPRSVGGTFSLHPAKNITTAEGGFIVSADSTLSAQFALYRSGGIIRNSKSEIGKAFYDISVVSSNYHLTDIQAAIGIIQLGKLDDFLIKRREQVLLYNSLFKQCSRIIGHNHPQSSAVNLYIASLVQHEFRESVFKFLNSSGIGAYYHYPLIHESSVYSKKLSHCPNASKYSLRAITLPLGPHLSKDDVEHISVTLVSFLESL